MKEKFIEFLKAHGCYEKFVQNLKNDHNADIDGLCSRNAEETWIGAAFDFEKTPERFAFWHRIDSKWRASVIIEMTKEL